MNQDYRTQSGENPPPWERVVLEKLAFEALAEQRATRRWRSVATQKYRYIKRRLFPHGGVARRCHRLSYVASSRLAMRKNPSALFASLFLCRDTSGIAVAWLLLLFAALGWIGGKREGSSLDKHTALVELKGVISSDSKQ